jgi:hypothetical protein
MSLKRVDEFDGITDAEIVEFSIAGVAYAIDLSEASKTAFIKHNQRYIDAARRMSKGSKKSTPKRSTTPIHPPAAARPAAEKSLDNDAIRAWATSTGRKVSDRGRIPKDVVAAFEEAHASNGSSAPLEFSGV